MLRSAILVPGLPAVVAGVLLPTGYGLRVLDGRPYVGDCLLTAGFLVGAVAAGAVVGDLIWRSVTAERNRSLGEDSTARDAGAKTAQAQQAAELALLERGMVPFLLARIEGERPGGPGRPRRAPVTPNA
ncbi:hypothetical protein [Streptomyces sp. NPDC047000]|uniref:hypothetical protein n=1 Tax=Streptomyces sp. NPDC047000 TaxID=3155474 RepID=UPI0033EE2A14